jgi:hypothetical protein
MNRDPNHLTGEAYSPECVEEVEFSEVRVSQAASSGESVQGADVGNDQS